VAVLLAGMWVELLLVRVQGKRIALCPILYRILCRVFDPILVHIRIQVWGSCIRGLSSLRSSRLLFLSWVLRPLVLFYRLLACLFLTSIFVLMHNLHLLDNAQKYISVVAH
jgi:hypothetical protein